MRTYNLFRRADRDELICAVPEDRPVPSFIIGPPWEFVERGDESVIGSLNFNREAAEASVQWNGFYLFQLIHASDFHQRIRQGIVARIVGDGSSEGEGSRQKAPERPSKIRLPPVEVELEFEVAPAPDSRVSFLRTLLDNVDLRSVRK